MRLRKRRINCDCNILGKAQGIKLAILLIKERPLPAKWNIEEKKEA